jgi:hypothetical protein
MLILERIVRHLEPLHMTAAARRPGKEMADVTLGAQSAVEGSAQGRAATAQQSSTSAAQDWLDNIEKIATDAALLRDHRPRRLAGDVRVL